MIGYSLGQLLASTRPTEKLPRRKIDPCDFEESPKPKLIHAFAIEPLATSPIFDRVMDAVGSLYPGCRKAGIRVGNRNFHQVEKWAHTYAYRYGMKVKTWHENGIVWVSEREGR